MTAHTEYSGWAPPQQMARNPLSLTPTHVAAHSVPPEHAGKLISMHRGADIDNAQFAV